MLKLCARPANRTLCPPPLRPSKRTDLSERPFLSRRSSISSSTSSLSSPESVRSDLSGFQARSRSSSISSVASSVLAPGPGSHISELLLRDEQPRSYPELSSIHSNVDCSSTLRPEEYTAADALLRFYELHRNEINEPADSRHHGSNRSELANRSKHTMHQPAQPASSAEKKKKKRSHSKTNLSDLLTMPKDDIQSLVRKNLMASCDEMPNIVIPDVDQRISVGRELKRNRSNKDQLLAASSRTRPKRIDRPEEARQPRDQETRALGRSIGGF